MRMPAILLASVLALVIALRLQEPAARPASRTTRTTSAPRNCRRCKAPPGLDPPDTRNALKVPPLDTPERIRGKNEPCLDIPPPFANPKRAPDAPQNRNSRELLLSCAPVKSSGAREHGIPDRWPSGRRRLLGKQVTSHGVPGFESLPVRQFFTMAVRIGSFATTSCKPRQARKGAAVAAMSGAEVRLVRAASQDPGTRNCPHDELSRAGAQVATAFLRGTRRTGARARRAGQCADARARASRLPVHRHARRGQDHHRAHPRRSASTAIPASPPLRAASARPARRSTRAASSTSSKSTPPRAPRSMTRASCSRTCSTHRRAAATRSTSSTKCTCCRRIRSTRCSRRSKSRRRTSSSCWPPPIRRSCRSPCCRAACSSISSACR